MTVNTSGTPKTPAPRLRCAFVWLGALMLATGLTPLSAQDYDVWPCRELPDFSEVEFLPIFLEGETPGFVDLGTLALEHEGETWKALQFTSDKQFEVEVPAGKWLFPLLGDEWPPDTVDVIKELHAGRLIGLVIDGDHLSVSPSCLLDLSSEEGSIAFYNRLVRFNSAGVHSLTVIWEHDANIFWEIHNIVRDVNPQWKPAEGND